MRNNVFDRINATIRSTEGSLVNLLSAIAPWLAPLAPAAMSWRHMIDSLAFDQFIAGAIAVVVEVMGLASVSTIIAFWSHNRNYKDDRLKAPVWIAVFTFVFYLGVILIMNVALDAANLAALVPYREGVVIFAKALLTLLSIPAAVLLAIRSQHHDLLTDMETRRQQAREARRQVSAPVDDDKAEKLKERRQKFFDDYQSGSLQQALDTQGFAFDGPSISRLYHVSERTGWRWIKSIKRGQNGRTN